jgi:hypothetical protein
MHLRAPKARPSVARGCCSATNELVRTMTNRMYWTVIASLAAIPLMLAANETSARSGAASRGGFTPTHSISRPFVGHSLRHQRRSNFGPFWPAVGGFYYGPDGEPLLDAAPPTSGDIRYTYTYDVPWDWAHRYPPAVIPSDRPYVSSCPAETVTVPGRGGSEQAVTVMRCY